MSDHTRWLSGGFKQALLGKDVVAVLCQCGNLFRIEINPSGTGIERCVDCQRVFRVSQQIQYWGQTRSTKAAKP